MRIANLFLSICDQPCLYVAKNSFIFFIALSSWRISGSDTSGTAFKKNGIQILLQLLDRLADSRLTDIKVPGTVGDTAGTCYRIKNMIKRQIILHAKPSFRKIVR